MTLHLHRAPRTDLLADALGELLSTPLEDPFATELVLVPARGVERWLSQRLSHRLGTSPGHGDGVCAGVELRSPRSLVAELPGPRDEDPWAPDALAWPLLQVLDESLDEPWAATLALHLGHRDAGDEAEFRRGRRYAVARRLAGLFASYAAQRPQLLVDWSAGRATDGLGNDLDADLAWQPPLWRAPARPGNGLRCGSRRAPAAVGGAGRRGAGAGPGRAARRDAGAPRRGAVGPPAAGVVVRPHPDVRHRDRAAVRPGRPPRPAPV